MRRDVWLVNTGWTGGPFGEGQRMPIQATRTMLHAALSGRLDDAELPHRRGLRLRGAGAGAGRRREAARPALDLARPRAYDRKARELAAMFVANFAKRFADVDESIRRRPTV